MARKRTREAQQAPLVGITERRALYLRVSTEDQAERGTIRAQLEFLRQKIEVENRGREMQGLPPIIIAGEYADDGISGTVPMAERPQGARLLDDARAGLFSSVFVYRLDRLGRRLRVILEAHDTLDVAGVAVVSATEPFDTSTPFGKAMFGFLGVMAELEKSTIADRTSNGRDAAVRGGRWVCGPIPYGYTTDEQGYLHPSELMVPGTGMTEAGIARGVFERLAEGGTTVSVCRWLNALGVPTTVRYRNGTTQKNQADAWTPARISLMVRRTLYSGRLVFNSRMGGIERECEALVTPEMQARAQAVVHGNLTLPSNASRAYILRGILRCGDCGSAYRGWLNTRAKTTGKATPSYRCQDQAYGKAGNGGRRCRGKILHAEDAERAVLAFARELYTNPGSILAKAQAALRERTGRTTDLEARRDALTRRLVQLDAERERMLTLYKRGALSLEDAEASLADTTASTGTVRAELDAIRSQEALAQAAEGRLVSAAGVLAQAGHNFDSLTPELQAEAIRRIIPEITVETTELPARRGNVTKEANLWARTFLGDAALVPSTSNPGSQVDSHDNRLGFVALVCIL